MDVASTRSMLSMLLLFSIGISGCDVNDGDDGSSASNTPTSSASSAPTLSPSPQASTSPTPQASASPTTTAQASASPSPSTPPSVSASPSPQPSSSPTPGTQPSASPQASATPSPTEAPLDTDNDGIIDIKDNCPTVPNRNQTDSNSNQIGDACEMLTGETTIKVLSNRSDLINGGNALIELITPDAINPQALQISLNGNDVSDAFGFSNDERYLGLVSGLLIGDNTLTAVQGNTSNSVNIRNHPQGGPVLAGPQLQPWTCRNANALDDQCNQAPEYSWHYLPEGEDALTDYDINNPPNDVATTITESGIEVPFIVRREIGYQDRDQYRIAVLYQPDLEWTAAAPQPQFNGKLMITHGASCGVDYETNGAPKVLSYNPLDFAGLDDPITPYITEDSAVYALGRGFAVMSTALNNSGHNCDLPLQAESMIMAKEHLIEQYGVLRYTIGAGCSGGSLAAQWVANAYPGIYQGILPTCSFPDTWSTATQFVDYHGLLLYFFADLIFTEGYQQWAPPEFQDQFDPAEYPFQPSQERSAEGWTLQSIADVMGHATVVNAHVSESAQFHVAVPDDRSGCGGVSDEALYDAQSNPDGVRCSIVDASINVFAPRPPQDWILPEVINNRGFAGFPLDNVGVQYGLGALQEGRITAQQFIDLNRDIGGLDIDTNFITERTPASQPALENAYRSGMINVGNNLNRTAIIDCRGPDPGLFHDAYRAFAMRARLDREHGNHDNQVIWGGPVPIIGDSSCSLNSFKLMDEWLGAVEIDDSEEPIAQKLTNNKPGAAVDSCWDGLGQLSAPVGCPETVLTVYGTPRMVAGDSIATDTNKCQLKAVDAADYSVAGLGLVSLLAPGQLDEIKAIFPDGVCDYTKPGVSFQGTIPWMTYSDDMGDVIYGGEALPARPENSGEGWMNPNFGGF